MQALQVIDMNHYFSRLSPFAVVHHIVNGRAQVALIHLGVRDNMAINAITHIRETTDVHGAHCGAKGEHEHAGIDGITEALHEYRDFVVGD
ncbi:hypothetical protein D3C76_1434110 [compost metagenome]